MPNRLYGLTEADRRAIRDVVRRTAGGTGTPSRRPTPTRRRNRSGEQASTAYHLVNCEDSNDAINVCNNLADSVGKVAVVRIGGVVVCYLIQSVTSCRGCECVEIIKVVDTCIDCLACYKLVNCDTVTGDPLVFYSRTKLLAAYVGWVVRFSDDETSSCFSVTRLNSSAGCTNPIEVIEPQVVGFDCNSCGNCLTVERCDDDTETLELSPGFEKNFPPHLGEFETLDNGAFVDPSDLIGFVFKLDGVCWEVTAYATCVGVPFVVEHIPTSQEWWADCDGCGCYELRPCEGQDDPQPPSLYVKYIEDGDGAPVNLADYEGGCDALRLAQNGYCYTVHHSNAVGCDTPETTFTVQETYPCGGFGAGRGGCTGCLCYEFELCTDSETTICSCSDFTRYLGYSEAGLDVDNIPPHVFKRAEDGFCYKLVGIATWSGSCVPFTIEAEYGEEDDACTLCDTGLVKLTPACSPCATACAGGTAAETPTDVYYSDLEALLAAIGQFVKIEGHCYEIQATDDEETPDTLPCWTGPYETCAACTAAPSVLRVITGFSTNEETGEVSYIYTTIVGGFTACKEGTGSLFETEDCEE